VKRAREAELEPNSLAARMAASSKDEGDRLSDYDLFSEIWELLASGFETVREALIWTVYLLAKHPLWSARPRSEVDRVAGREKIRAEHVPELAAAEMFFSESLRLYPPTRNASTQTAFSPKACGQGRSSLTFRLEQARACVSPRRSPGWREFWC